MSRRPIRHQQSIMPSVSGWHLLPPRRSTVHPVSTWSILIESWANSVRRCPPRAVHAQPGPQHWRDAVLGWRVPESCWANDLQPVPCRDLVSRWLRRLSRVPAWSDEGECWCRILRMLPTGLLLRQWRRLLHAMPPWAKHGGDLLRRLRHLSRRPNVGPLSRRTRGLSHALAGFLPAATG